MSFGAKRQGHPTEAAALRGIEAIPDRARDLGLARVPAQILGRVARACSAGRRPSLGPSQSAPSHARHRRRRFGRSNLAHGRDARDHAAAYDYVNAVRQVHGVMSKVVTVALDDPNLQGMLRCSPFGCR